MKNRSWAGVLALQALLAVAGTASAQPGPPPPLPPPPVPPENPQTAAKIALGKALFWDEQLSTTRTVACGTCHRPASGGSDPRTAPGGFATTNPGPDGLFGVGGDDILASAGVPLNGANGMYQASTSFGVTPQVGRRKSPTIVNAGYMPELFWDGRAGQTFVDPDSGQILIATGGALESQALAPLLDTSEMGHTGNVMSGVTARIANGPPLALASQVPASLATWIGGRSYAELFEEVFGTPEITPARMAFALASYERSVSDTDVPFDAGVPTLPPEQAQGRQVFDALQCNVCHAGPLHSDNSYRYIGVRPVDDDLGRFEVTGFPPDRGRFRVPSLRNVGLRAPYMHNGRFATLELVVDFYLRGGDFDAPNKDPLIVPRSITPQQKAALVSYLRNALSDPRLATEQSPFDRPRLYTEGANVPVLVGTGTSGSTGFAPEIVALEPPFFGNERFTVAAWRARSDASATLVVGRADPGVQATLPTGDFANVATTTSNGGFISAGYASVQLDLSQDPALVGQTLFGRWYVADPGAPNGLAISRAFRITVFDAGYTPDVLLRDGFE